jgi:hypothetical protein
MGWMGCVALSWIFSASGNLLLKVFSSGASGGDEETK